MGLPLRYSIQPSPLAPDGFEGEYGRMQVDYRPAQKALVVTADEYDEVAFALSEGRAIWLKDDSGRVLGQFIVGLAGGFDIATFTQASVSDLRISFRPSQELLTSTREITTFEQVPTVVKDPTITKFTYSAMIAGQLQVKKNKICHGVDTGVIEIVGTNFVKNGMNVAVTQFVDGITSTTELVTNSTLPSGSKAMSFHWYLSKVVYQTGKLKLPDYTRLIVSRIDNPSRSAFIDCEFVECTVPAPI